jgi:hypothetical protein
MIALIGIKRRELRDEMERIEGHKIADDIDNLLATEKWQTRMEDDSGEYDKLQALWVNYAWELQRD